MRELVIDYLNSLKQPVTIDEISLALNLTSDEDYLKLGELLSKLEDEFIITHSKKYKFGPLRMFDLYVGTLDVKEYFGFVDTDTKGIFVKENDFHGAYQGDTVLVKKQMDFNYRKCGVIQRIIKRGFTTLTGNLIYQHKCYYLASFDKKLKDYCFINNGKLNGAQTNDLVKVNITSYNPLSGEVVEVIGKSYDPGSDVTAILKGNDIALEFSEEVKEEVKLIPSIVSEEECLNRVDLTDKLIITIDSLTAKDLDDAIRVEKLENGDYLLGVYIADVSHYVKDDTFIDLEAMDRGTSIYVVDRCIPMLPKELSNGICSLNEGEKRLVLGVEQIISPLGEVKEASIFEGIIKVTHRMNYDDVEKIIHGDNSFIDKYGDVYPLLNNAYELSKILNNKRFKKGAFFFENPRTLINIDETGNISSLDIEKRKESEKIIEEFMLSANIIVAERMSYLDVPFIYRIHSYPDTEKINNLLSYVNSLGYHYSLKQEKSIPKILQQILQDFSDASPNINLMVNFSMIRSMAKAKYDINNIGHFGLGERFYTHFTSPIRRYPDLMVHRLVKQFLLGIDIIKDNPLEYYEDKVSNAAIISSEKERKAERLERDIDKFKICKYYYDKIGEIYNAVVSDINMNGYYVLLDNGVEGFVPSFSKVSIGLKCKVKLNFVDIIGRKIEFKRI